MEKAKLSKKVWGLIGLIGIIIVGTCLCVLIELWHPPFGYAVPFSVIIIAVLVKFFLYYIYPGHCPDGSYHKRVIVTHRGSMVWQTEECEKCGKYFGNVDSHDD